MSSSWRFHCHIQSLEAFVISNNPNISNPLKIIWVGKEKKLIETCTWKQRRAVWILNFRLYNFWGAPIEGGGVLHPLHMQTKLHMNISLTRQYVTHFHNAASFKSTSSDKNIPQFLRVFQGFFFFFLPEKLALVHKTQLIAPSNDGICFPKTKTILGLKSLRKMCQLF